MQISRFTSSKPSKFAFASDEKSIRQPTTSFARCYLNLLFLWNMPYWFLSLLPSRLRTRSCSFLARQKGTKERPEGAEEGASLDFSPLWTPPAAKVSCGKEWRLLRGLTAFPCVLVFKTLLQKKSPCRRIFHSGRAFVFHFASITTAVRCFRSRFRGRRSAARRPRSR